MIYRVAFTWDAMPEADGYRLYSREGDLLTDQTDTGYVMFREDPEPGEYHADLTWYNAAGESPSARVHATVEEPIQPPTEPPTGFAVEVSTDVEPLTFTVPDLEAQRGVAEAFPLRQYYEHLVTQPVVLSADGLPEGWFLSGEILNYDGEGPGALSEVVLTGYESGGINWEVGS